MKPIKRNRSSEQGSTIVEFAIITPLLVLLFFGSVGLGIMMGRYIQTIQVCRDVAHMYADGVNFTDTHSQDIVTQQLASGTGMTNTGGNGVVILTKIKTIYQADCDAAGFTSNCVNIGLAVIIQRITFGQPSLRASSFGTPTSTLMDSLGNIAPSVYIKNTDASVQATAFTPLLAAAGTSQQQGDTAWVTEVFFTYPDIGYLGTEYGWRRVLAIHFLKGSKGGILKLHKRIGERGIAIYVSSVILVMAVPMIGLAIDGNDVVYHKIPFARRSGWFGACCGQRPGSRR